MNFVLLSSFAAAVHASSYKPTTEIEQFQCVCPPHRTPRLLSFTRSSPAPPPVFSALPRYDGASNTFVVPTSVSVAALTGPKSYILGAVGPGVVLIAFGIVSLCGHKWGRGRGTLTAH